MNQELVRARKELFAKRDVEFNLPCYLKNLAGVYYRMANYNLAMQYTSFAEGVAEGDVVLPEKAKEYAEIVKQYVEALAKGECALGEEALTRIGNVRQELTVAMQALTAYTDRLYLHEYALQRLAPGMEGTAEEIDSNGALEEISSFLFFDEEQEGLLARVSAVVSELPVRMTKAKFIEWVRNTASVYKEADAETLDRVFYMLYSASGLYEPEGMELFPECREALCALNALDYRSITEEQYVTAKRKLEEITEFIVGLSDVYFSLTELVNSLLTILFTEGYVMPADTEATKGCREIYRLLSEKTDFSDVALVEAFETFEGLPEQIEEFLFTEEAYFDELPVDEKLLSAMMQKVLYTRVAYARRLHTTSIFVKLQNEDTKELSFDGMLDEFCVAVTKVLEEGQRAVNRGVMARVIQNLPLPFTRKSDIQKYVLASLENCHDMSEKTAAMRAIRELAEGM
ncbi:MAG: hypothetical protein IKB07_02245 [Lachnospiraceae bacterium]|nr:hypothetical protein [Lachnospiraceae bacterium]